MIKEGVNPQEKEVADQEEYTSRILLHFIRHGQKESIEGKPNFEMRLTEEGKQQSIDKGRKREVASPTAMAYGSKMVRSQEEAIFEWLAAAGVEDLSVKESYEDMKVKVNQGLGYGSRVGVDKRLGFKEEPAFQKLSEEAYNKKEGLKFMVEKSDDIVKDQKDKTSTSYSRVSAQIAQVLEKYSQMAPQWGKLVKVKENEYGKVLERFMGSHSGVIDVFLCKLVEKIKKNEGKGERDKLIAALNNQGFDFTEGFDIEIDMKKDSKEPEIKIKYNKQDAEGKELFTFNEVITQEVLDDIIGDGDKLNKSIEESESND